MLKISKTINLNGSSEIDGQVIAYMSASISTEGNNSNINKVITNQELYNANKSTVRTDFIAFEDEVYKIEDEINSTNAIKVGK